MKSSNTHYASTHPMKEIKVLPEYKELVQNVVKSRKNGLISQPQGLIVNINHVTGEAVVIPAFNKNDGSTALMRQVCTYTQKKEGEEKQVPCYLESSQPRGGFNGDLHTGALNRAKWGEHGGVHGGVSGMAIFLDEKGEIQEIRNRSSSQNFYAYKWGWQFRTYFKWRTSMHGSHSADLLREVPLVPFQYYINQVLVQLGFESAGELLKSKWILGGRNGILEHLKIEADYMIDSEDSLKWLIEKLIHTEDKSTHDARVEEILGIYKHSESALNSYIEANLIKLYLSNPDNFDKRYLPLIKNNPRLHGNILISLISSGQYQKFIDKLQDLKSELKANEFEKIINFQNKAGNTPLIIATQEAKLEYIKALCEAGARSDILNNRNEDALKLSLVGGHIPIIRYLESLKSKQKLDNVLHALQQLSQFLNKKFLESKKGPKEAKLFRSKIIEVARCSLTRRALEFPGYIAEIKKVVSQCQFMHYAPKLQYFSFAQPKYAVSKQEGILIPGSSPALYGTHHSTHLFYQLCEALTTPSGKIDAHKFEYASKALNKLYGFDNDHKTEIFDFLTTNSDLLNLDSKQPNPAENLAQDILMLLCLEQKVAYETQFKITDQAKDIVLQIVEDKTPVLEKMEFILKIRNLIADTPKLRIGFGQPSFIAQQLYISRDSAGLEISISGAVKMLDQISKESLAQLFKTLTEDDKIRFISQHVTPYSWLLNCKNFTPSQELNEMTSEIAQILERSSLSVT